MQIPVYSDDNSYGFSLYYIYNLDQYAKTLNISLEDFLESENKNGNLTSDFGSLFRDSFALNLEWFKNFLYGTYNPNLYNNQYINNPYFNKKYLNDLHIIGLLNNEWFRHYTELLIFGSIKYLNIKDFIYECLNAYGLINDSKDKFIERLERYLLFRYDVKISQDKNVNRHYSLIKQGNFCKVIDESNKYGKASMMDDGMYLYAEYCCMTNKKIHDILNIDDPYFVSEDWGDNFHFDGLGFDRNNGKPIIFDVKCCSSESTFFISEKELNEALNPLDNNADYYFILFNRTVTGSAATVTIYKVDRNNKRLEKVNYNASKITETYDMGAVTLPVLNDQFDNKKPTTVNCNIKVNYDKDMNQYISLEPYLVLGTSKVKELHKNNKDQKEKINLVLPETTLGCPFNYPSLVVDLYESIPVDSKYAKNKLAKQDSINASGQKVKTKIP